MLWHLSSDKGLVPSHWLSVQVYYRWCWGNLEVDSIVGEGQGMSVQVNAMMIRHKQRGICIITIMATRQDACLALLNWQ